MADPKAEVHLSTQIDKMMSIRNGLIRNRGNCMIYTHETGVRQDSHIAASNPLRVL